MSESLGHAVAIRDEDERGSNRSSNPHIQDIIDARVSRRRFLGGTANPTAVSSWPFGGRPRSATVVIRKLDGGRIGS